VGSVMWPAKRGVAGAHRCIAAQGKGGFVTGVRCHASVRAVRGQVRAGCTGTPLRALRGLGARAGTGRRGRGGSHGQARVILFQGIGSTVQDRLGGEVTSREVDGGVQARLEWPRWAWRWQGGVGCWPGSLQGGAASGVSAMRLAATGGRGRCLVEESEGEGKVLAASASGSSPPSSPSCRRQKEGICKISGLQKNISSRSSPSLGRFVKRKRGKGE
jgi:hypothetical protein